MRIVSWNVNGLRAVVKKGFLEWFNIDQPDVLCLQETKAHPDQLDAEVLEPAGYRAYYNAAERKGYSGVSTWCKTEPLSVNHVELYLKNTTGIWLILLGLKTSLMKR